MARSSFDLPVLRNDLMLEAECVDEKNIRTPQKVSPEELKRLTITIEGCDYISFGNALLCPKCGIQQRVLRNEAPDKEFGFYLKFECEHYNLPKTATEPKDPIDK